MKPSRMLVFLKKMSKKMSNMFDLTKNEMMVLSALANGAAISDYSHLNREIHRLHSFGFVRCFFDEQNQVISGSVTPEGRQFLISKQ